MKSKYPAIILVTILCSLAGLVIGNFLHQPALGIAIGFFAGLPMGQYAVTGRRRWIAIAFLNTEYILSFAVGGWKGLVYSLTASILTFFLSAAILRELYGGDEIEAFRQHVNLAFGTLRGFQIVDEGKTVIPSGGGVLLGPRFVIVRPGNAVVTERIARLKGFGPGTFKSEPFEYVKHIYDLRERQVSLSYDDVMTCDPVPAVLKMSASYALEVSDSARRDARPLNDTEREFLVNIPFKMSQWEALTKAALEQSLRQTIRTRSMDELLSDVDYGELEEEMRRLANLRSRDWHVCVNQVMIESVQPNAESASAMDGRYRERIRAQGLREALVLLAQGYRQAKRFGLSESEIYRETVRRTLEAMSKDPSTKFVFGPEVQELLGDLGATPKTDVAAP